MLKILLHVCCGPCGIYPLIELGKKYQVTVFYYNPNIHPETEYSKRREAAKNYCEKNNIAFIEEAYNSHEYFNVIKNYEQDKKNRCPLCYQLSLEKTAAYAATHNFEAFTSTLLISPHQDINLIKKIGEELAIKHKIEFYNAEKVNSQKKYKGFRPGFSQGRKLAHSENMYLQHYCGCVFSQNEL
jgi:hypothetical protein